MLRISNGLACFGPSSAVTRSAGLKLRRDKYGRKSPLGRVLATSWDLQRPIWGRRPVPVADRLGRHYEREMVEDGPCETRISAIVRTEAMGRDRVTVETEPAPPHPITSVTF